MYISCRRATPISNRKMRQTHTVLHIQEMREMPVRTGRKAEVTDNGTWIGITDGGLPAIVCPMGLTLLRMERTPLLLMLMRMRMLLILCV